MGLIARDEHGRFVAARVVRFDNVFSPAHAEALAAREGLAMIVERGLSNIILLCDSLQITTALQEHSTDMSFIGFVIEDAKAFMSAITGVVPAHICHQATEMAHRLARFALRGDGSRSWFEEPSDFLANLFVIECLG